MTILWKQQVHTQFCTSQIPHIAWQKLIWESWLCRSCLEDWTLKTICCPYRPSSKLITTPLYMPRSQRVSCMFCFHSMYTYSGMPFSSHSFLHGSALAVPTGFCTIAIVTCAINANTNIMCPITVTVTASIYADKCFVWLQNLPWANTVDVWWFSAL